MTDVYVPRNTRFGAECSSIALNCSSNYSLAKETLASSIPSHLWNKILIEVSTGAPGKDYPNLTTM